MAKQTNIEAVTQLMDFSQHGALMQGFVLQAIEQYAQQVLANKDQISDTGMISKQAWVGCAQEALGHVTAHLGA